MFLCYVIALLLLFVTVLVNSLQVQQVKTTVLEFPSPGGTIQVVMANLYFDADVYIQHSFVLNDCFNSDYSSSINRIDELPVCLWSKLSDYSQSFDSTPIDLKCQDVSHFPSSSTNSDTYPYEKETLLQMLPCSDDSIHHIMLFRTNKTESIRLSNRLKLDSKCLSAFFIVSMTDEVTKKTEYLSQINNLISQFKQGKCSITVKQRFLASAASSSSSLNTEGSFPISSYDTLARPCDLKKLLQSIASFDELLSKAKSITNQYQVDLLQNRIFFIAATDAWMNCENILKKAAVIGSKNSTFVTKECPYKEGTSDYANDPCCNQIAAFIKCCAPRKVTITYSTVTGMNVDLVANVCDLTESNVGTVLESFDNYISDRSIASSYETGCFATRLKALGGTGLSDISELWNVASKFMDNCGKEIFGDNYRSIFYGGYINSLRGKQCKTNSDCYTNCVYDNPLDKNNPSIYGYCSIPWKDQIEYLAKCYLKSMDNSILDKLADQLGLTKVNETTFAKAIQEKCTREQCTGSQSYHFTAGYYQVNTHYCSSYKSGQQCEDPKIPTAIGYDSEGSPMYDLSIYQSIAEYKYTLVSYYKQDWMLGDDKYFYVPSNRTACLKMKACNYNNYTEPCLTDKLSNDNYFCAKYSDGITTVDISRAGFCKLDMSYDIYEMFSSNSDPYELVCGFLGGKKNNYGDCVDKAFSTESACFDYCKNGINPSMPKQCLSRSITSDEDCRKYNGWINWYWLQTNAAGTNNQRKICIIDRYAFQSYASSGYYGTITDSEYQTACSKVGADFAYQDLFIGDDAKAYLYSQCSSSFCYNSNLDQSNCWNAPVGSIPDGFNAYRYYQNGYRNSQGLCVMNFYKSSYGSTAKSNQTFASICKSMVGMGWKWHQGRNWINGVYDSQTKCSEGSCSLDETLTKEQCLSGASCSRTCRGCLPNTEYGTTGKVCFHRNQTMCSSGVWTTFNNTNICLYKNDIGIQDCQRIGGSRVLSCDALDRNKCWSNPFKEILDCKWDYANCKNETDCYESGYCNDYEFVIDNNWSEWNLEEEDRIAYLNPSLAPAVSCLLPGKINSWGYRECSNAYEDIPSSIQSSFSKIGCVYLKLDKSICSKLGGKLVKRARNRNECLSFKGCCEPGNDCNWKLTDKNEDECTKCGGQMIPIFTWYGGTWSKGEMIPNEWKKRELVSVNAWTIMANMYKMDQFVFNAIAARVGEIIEAEMNCRFGSMMNYLKIIGCYCGVNNIDDSCVRKQETKVPLASGSLRCGVERDINSAGIRVKFGSNSLVDCNSQASYEILKLEPSPSRSLSNSSSLIKRSVNNNNVQLTARSTISSNCYAFVRNTFGAFIGQFRGDCVILNPSVGILNVEICMVIKDTIPWDSNSYPNPAIAIRTVDPSGKENYTALFNYAVLESNKQFCAKVNEKGTFCPVSVMKNGQSISSRPQPSCDVSSTAMQAISAATARLVGSAVKLKFTVQPSSTIAAGSIFNPAIVVNFITDQGNVATDASASAILTLSSNNGASIIGTARVAAVNGVCVFDNVAVNLMGSDYKFVVSSSNLAIDTSASFSVTAGVAYGLAFIVQPGGAVVNLPFMQQPKVSVIDSYGNQISSNVPITMTAYRDGAIVSFSGSSTATVNTVNGIAAFTNLALSSDRSGYYLIASSPNLKSATSSTFNVVPASGYAVKLRFKTSPMQTGSGQELLPHPSVEAVDGLDKTVITTGTVSISLKPGSGSSQAILSGTKRKSFSNGLATFSGLSIDHAASGYVLVATSDGLVDAESSAFRVNGAARLIFAVQPSPKINGTFSVTVQVLDDASSVFTDGSFVIYLNLKPLSGGSNRGVLSGTIRASTSNGIAIFSGLSISPDGKQYILVASDEDSIFKVESNAFDVESVNSPSSNNNGGGVKDITGKISSALGVSTEVAYGIIIGVCSTVVILVLASIVQRRRNMTKIKQRRESRRKSNASKVQHKDIEITDVEPSQTKPQIKKSKNITDVEPSQTKPQIKKSKNMPEFQNDVQKPAKSKRNSPFDNSK